MIVSPDALENELRGEAGTALPRNASSPGHAASIVVKSGPCLFYGFEIYSSNTVAQFILVFDRATLPADGAVADIVFTIAATSNLPIEYTTPRAMLRGLVLCNSSTEPTKTIGAADCSWDVQYI